MQLKSCDQSLYVLSLYDRVQPVVYGSAKNERGNRDQTWTACQKKYGSQCVHSVACCIGQEDHKISRQGIRILSAVCAIGVHFQLLTWKETKYGKQDPSKPLFMTKRNTPIHSLWMSTCFSQVAARAGIREKIPPKLHKIRAHSARHLLKSAPKTYGCASCAADHVLGRAPRDPYEKQAILYPENLRAQYAKASSRLNIFSKVSSTLNTADDPENMHARIKELEAQVAGTSTTNAGTALLERRHRKSMQEMHDVIESLGKKNQFDSTTT